MADASNMVDAAAGIPASALRGAAAGITTGTTILELCMDLVGRHFKEHKPLVAELETFCPNKNAPLAPLFRSDAKIPIDPLDGNPSLLLSGLDTCDGCVDTEVYKYLEKSSRGVLPAALYATSGGGKTRSLFEYLSCTKGLYFVAGRNMLRERSERSDPGSTDLGNLFQLFGKEVATVGTPQGMAASQANLAKTYNRVGVMILVRYLVHQRIEECLARKITPYEWLLYQLYPEKFLGADIYADALAEFVNKEEEIDLESLSKAIVEVVRTKDENKRLFKLCCIDEAQSLLEDQLPTQLFLSTDGTEYRTSFYGVLSAFSEHSIGLASCCPVFSGTGLSIDDLHTHSKSIVAKRVLGATKPSIFSQFSSLNVTEYLKKFLVVDDLRPEVLSHVAKWLNGRPRWTASFLEAYLVRGKRDKYADEVRTRGSFNLSEALIMEALDRFLLVVTSSEQDQIDRKVSWSAGDRSAYAAIMRVAQKKHSRAMDDMGIAFSFAVFEFAVGKVPSLFSEKTHELIQAGVCQVKTTVVAGTTRYKAALDEPIIVQAGINFYGLDNALELKLTVQEKGGRGHAFEKLMLPAFQDNERFGALVQKQLGQQNIFSGYSVSRMSSYGVLAESCATAQETLKWMQAATSAWFEGTVPLFCYPDEDFGPDLMFLLWNLAFTDFRTCIAQAKFKNEVGQLSALRTIMPSLLYHENRDGKKSKPPILSTKIDESTRQMWEKAKKKLMGNERPCLRLMVQYPAYGSSVADQGRCDPDIPSPKYQKTSKSQKTGRDGLVTIRGDNVGNLFGKETAALLTYIKMDSRNGTD